MTAEEFKGRLASYMVGVMAPKARSWQAKFSLGAGAVIVPRRVDGVLESVGAICADGSVDVEMVREAVLSGFDASGRFDALGGLIGVEKADAEDFFAFLGVQEGEAHDGDIR